MSSLTPPPRLPPPSSASPSRWVLPASATSAVARANAWHRCCFVGTQVAPFAMLVEKAGGKTSDGVTGKSCLDIKIEAVDQVILSRELPAFGMEGAARGRGARGGGTIKRRFRTSDFDFEIARG